MARLNEEDLKKIAKNPRYSHLIDDPPAEIELETQEVPDIEADTKLNSRRELKQLYDESNQIIGGKHGTNKARDYWGKIAQKGVSIHDQPGGRIDWFE